MCMRNIIHYDVLDSTSIHAHQHLTELNDFDIISCDLQTSGHGQFERKWYSSDKNGGNIYISIVLKPENISHLDELTRYVALCAAKTLRRYGLEPKFKYPNDILINGKKIAGFLAESEFMGENLKGVIVGCGINLNLQKEDIEKIDIPATSIYLETGKKIDKNDFLNKLVDDFEYKYELFLKEGLKEIEEMNYV